jgi:hypothetical protein
VQVIGNDHPALAYKIEAEVFLFNKPEVEIFVQRPGQGIFLA